MKNIYSCKTHFRKVLSVILVTAVAVLQLSGCSNALNLPLTAASSDSSSQQTAAISSVPSSPGVYSPSSSMPAASSSSAVSSKVQKSSSTAPVKAKTKSGSSKSDVKSIKKINETPASQTVQRKTISKSAASASGYSYIAQKIGYNSLTSDSERALYSLIGNSVYQIAVNQTSGGYYPTGKISIPGKFSEAQLIVTITAYLNDNPQVFWIVNSYSYSYSGNETSIQLYSYISPENCNTAVASLNSSVAKIIQSMPLGLSEFDREEYLFNYLVNNCSYDYAAVSDSSKWQAFTAYGAVTDGKVVCEGYSRAMQLLSSYAGLQCTLMRGESNGVAHMWNAININSSWYHLDITWCDNTFLIYNYFNVTDTVIKKSHTVAPAASTLTDAQISSCSTQYNLALPTCNSSQANYFNVKGIKITSLNDSDDDAVIQSLAAELKTGKTQFVFRVNEKSDYSSTVNALLKNSPYKMSTYIQKAAQLAGISLSTQKISYITDEYDRGINVKLV